MPTGYTAAVSDGTINEADFPRICAALVAHINIVQAQRAA